MEEFHPAFFYTGKTEKAVQSGQPGIYGAGGKLPLLQTRLPLCHQFLIHRSAVQPGSKEPDIAQIFFYRGPLTLLFS
jgi:hypothetical protein